MIRKATEADLEGVLCLYDEMHDAQEAGLICTNWKRGIYPSRITAVSALERNDLFVIEENSRIIGSGIINQVQLGKGLNVIPVTLTHGSGAVEAAVRATARGRW